MNYNKVCVNCMNETQIEHGICPNCGFDMNNYFIHSYELPPFTILNGKYLLGRAIGSGGFGITYVARDLVLGRIVAIKEFFMQGAMYRSQTQPITITGITSTQGKIYEINAEKFEKEAVILAKLDSLNGIVQVYDFFKENGTAYIVMEYLSGDTLKEYVSEHGGKLSLDETLEKLMPVMQSLSQIHKNGIIHRDISPDNMKFFNDEQLKLIDFGGAKIQSAGALSEMSFKKAGYTPIEMYSAGGKQGAWTDVYAMCATIYYCITGKVPDEAAKRIESDKLQRPSELGAEISKKMENVLMKGLELRSQDRYQTMEELQQALSGAKVLKKQGKKEEKQKRKKIYFILPGVAALGVAGIFALYLGAQSRRPMVDTGSIPEVLDSSTVFTEEVPLTITGRNLQYVDSIYLNDREVDDLEILEQTEHEMKVVFSLPTDEESLEFSLVSHFMGVFPAESEADEIRMYESGTAAPEIETVSKNGRMIDQEMIRFSAPFSLEVAGTGVSEGDVLLLNDIRTDFTYENDTLLAEISQELVDELNSSGNLTIEIQKVTDEGYVSSKKSGEWTVAVSDWYTNNLWAYDLYEQNFQIIDFDRGLENTEEAVAEKIEELYDQGTRYFRYNPEHGVTLSHVVRVLEQKEGVYLILNLTGSADMQAVYDELTGVCGVSDFWNRIVAMINSQEAHEQWRVNNKAQDGLMYLFKLDGSGMTFQETVDFLNRTYIRAVSFESDSYWSNVYLRNRDSILEMERIFIYENPDNVMDVYQMKKPTEFSGVEDMIGVTGIISESITMDVYNSNWNNYQNALALRNMENGSSAREYLNLLEDSGYTVFLTVRDDGNEIDSIAAEFDRLGIHSSILGGSQGFRSAYIGVVKTSVQEENELVYEERKTVEEGAWLEYDYPTDHGSFHLVSGGRLEDGQDSSELTGEISFEGVNFSQDQAGINIVVYDEQNGCIVDAVWIDTWSNQDNPEPVISRNQEKQWMAMLQDVQRKADRKQKITDYFNWLAEVQSEYLILIAAADDGSSNIDEEILAAMNQIGIAAPFGSEEGFGKSYVGVFGKDAELFADAFVSGANDTFSDAVVSLSESDFYGHTIEIVSRGSGVEDSSAQIRIDGAEMTNEIRGLHILVYDPEEQKAVNYTWIDCWDNLKTDSEDLM